MCLDGYQRCLVVISSRFLRNYCSWKESSSGESLSALALADRWFEVSRVGHSPKYPYVCHGLNGGIYLRLLPLFSLIQASHSPIQASWLEIEFIQREYCSLHPTSRHLVWITRLKLLTKPYDIETAPTSGLVRPSLTSSVCSTFLELIKHFIWF